MSPLLSKARAWTILLGIFHAPWIGMILFQSAAVVDAWAPTSADLRPAKGPKRGGSYPTMTRGVEVAPLSSHADMGELPPQARSASRRAVLQRSIQWAAATAAAGATAATTMLPAASAEDTAVTAEGSNVPKFVQEYSDFVESPLGFSYRVVPSPSGTASSAVAARGDRVVFDWSGYTIGYFGRPFQAKGGPQGGAFDKDLDYARVVLGSHSIVDGLELSLEGMKAGEVRQVIVPYGKLSYPEDDPGHDRVGPKPSTFSGERALDFVLKNPRLDRTLLFNVKVIRVDKPNGKGGFVRG